jgi:NadR type nicotinamide-nucleotide adenylyltransferase
VSALRVAVFGPESTGKTSLAEKLAARFGEPWAPEYVRRFWDERGGRVTADDLDAIARGQIAAEEDAASRARRVVFCDTELLTNVLWADLLFPQKCPAWVRERAGERARRYAVYLLCGTDIAFEPDPQRCFPDEAGRQMCMRLWRGTLLSRGLPVVEIAGDWPEREARAVAAVEAILSGGQAGRPA